MNHSASTAEQNHHQPKQVLSKALINAAQMLDLRRKQLAQILGISEASLSRVYDSSRLIDPDNKEGELALLLLRLYRSLDTLFGGNNEQCQHWLNAYNHHLQGVPIDMMTHIEGLIVVIRYCDAMRGKI